MRLLRRFVVMAAWSFWLGGFLFYTAIVVPTSMRVLERHPTQPRRIQGFVTREVAQALNVSGAIALTIFAVDAWLSRRAAKRWAWLQAILVLMMAGGIAALAILHPAMDAMLDIEAETVSNGEAFYLMHRWYLWISTVQWGAGVLYLLTLPVVWQREDRGT